jgi:hypothetical protein
MKQKNIGESIDLCLFSANAARTRPNNRGSVPIGLHLFQINLGNILTVW